MAAPVLAATLPQSAPLRGGLLRLGQQDPQAFKQTAYAVIEQLPDLSVSGALFSAALTRVMTGILRPLAEDSPDAYLPDLATALTNLGVRLAGAGQRQAALAPAQEAVTIRRQLAEANPDAYLPGLAAALNNLGIRLAEAGQRQAALAPAQEAVTIRRQLAAANPDAYLPGLAAALDNLGNQLAGAGQRQAALGPAQEAVDIYRQLADANPDAYLPDLAMALSNLGNQLAEAGQRQAALAPAQEAVDHLPPARRSQPRRLPPRLRHGAEQPRHPAGRSRAAAGRPGRRPGSRHTYRQLAEASPDAYLPDLAAALNNLGVRLAEAGQRQAALAAAQEAVTIRRQLAEASPDAYLPDLATALNNLGNRLAETGQRQAALAAAQEAVTIRRQLAEANPDAYLPDLAAALNNLGDPAGRGRAAAGRPGSRPGSSRHLPPARRGQPRRLPPRPSRCTEQPGQPAGRDRAAAGRPGRRPGSRPPSGDSSPTANPDAYLPDLATALNNLGIRLAEAGQDAEVSRIWESAIAGLPNEPSQLALTVAYASYLLGQPNPGTGVELPVKS